MAEPGLRPAPLHGWRAGRTACRCPRTRRPEAVIAGSRPAPTDPGVLWGDWFGGGRAARPPAPVRTPTGAADAGFAGLDEQPDAGRRRRPDLVGGGWLAVPRLRPGLDRGRPSTTRCCAGGAADGWAFESLGLDGREAADARRPGALAPGRWPPPTERPAGADVRIAVFAHPGASPRPTRTDYLGAVEEVIGRIHRGDFYQLNLCLRLHATLAEPAPALFARVAGTAAARRTPPWSSGPGTAGWWPASARSCSCGSGAGG